MAPATTYYAESTLAQPTNGVATPAFEVLFNGYQRCHWCTRSPLGTRIVALGDLANDLMLRGNE